LRIAKVNLVTGTQDSSTYEYHADPKEWTWRYRAQWAGYMYSLIFLNYPSADEPVPAEKTPELPKVPKRTIKARVKKDIAMKPEEGVFVAAPVEDELSEDAKLTATELVEKYRSPRRRGPGSHGGLRQVCQVHAVQDHPPRGGPGRWALPLV
ncbi:MAG: hypothetical protein MZV70_54565, partial [Desulfobacterales bacterium]|nr:hypothetical protein [Desulfobacterales bacterium]